MLCGSRSRLLAAISVEIPRCIWRGFMNKYKFNISYSWLLDYNQKPQTTHHLPWWLRTSNHQHNVIHTVHAAANVPRHIG